VRACSIWLRWRVRQRSNSSAGKDGTGAPLRRAGHLDRGLLLLHELEIQARTIAASAAAPSETAATAAQNGCGHAKRTGVGIARFGDAIHHVDAREARQRIFHLRAALTRLCGLGEVDRLGRILPRDAAEILLHLGQRLLRVEIAHQREDGVVRRVVGLEELLDVVDRSGVEIVHGADDGMMVGEVIVDQFFDLLGGLPVGRIVAAQAPLLFHGLPLLFQILGRDDEAAHTVGLEEQAEVELVLGHRLVVGGAVGIGGAVRVAAVGIDQKVELAYAHVLRPLEHHVFEEVGEAGAALALVLRPDLIADADGIDRRA
jgi:hypothetical protein